MTIITDKVKVKNGTDYSFICSKIPFAISCSSSLQHCSYNLIDLDLVNKMKIPLQRIQVCRMTYLGESLRSVGYIDQTIHCIENGVVKGTVHLSAKVVRNLFDIFNVDCIASYKTYERLSGNKPPDPPDVDGDNNNEKEDNLENNHDDNISTSAESNSSSTCSDGRHNPINKEWLFQASLIADVAQRDPPDVLLAIENEKAVNQEDEEDIETDNEPEDDNNKPKLCTVFGNQCTNEACTKTEDDEDSESDSEEEMHCELCFKMGQPVRIVTNHNNHCPTCPTMTPKQKETELGTDWKTKAEVIIRKRHKREKQKRKGSADL